MPSFLADTLEGDLLPVAPMLPPREDAPLVRIHKSPVVRLQEQLLAVAHRGQRMRFEVLALVDHEFLPVPPVLPPRGQRRDPSTLGRRRVDVGRALGALAQEINVVARPERSRRPIGLDLPDLVVHRPAVEGGTQQTVLLRDPGRRAFTANSSNPYHIINKHGVGAAVVVVLRAIIRIQPM